MEQPLSARVRDGATAAMTENTKDAAPTGSASQRGPVAAKNLISNKKTNASITTTSKG